MFFNVLAAVVSFDISLTPLAFPTFFLFCDISCFCCFFFRAEFVAN